MKKLYRVKESRLFKQILDQRQILGKNSSFTIYFSSNTLDHGRIGLSVSKKLGNAVVRSKIRRQIRAMMDQIDILKSKFDFIIIVKQTYHDNSFETNLKNLKLIFDEIKEIK